MSKLCFLSCADELLRWPLSQALKDTEGNFISVMTYDLKLKSFVHAMVINCAESSNAVEGNLRGSKVGEANTFFSVSLLENSNISIENESELALKL